MRRWLVPWRIALVSVVISELVYAPFYFAFLHEYNTGWYGFVISAIIPISVAYPISRLVHSLIKELDELNDKLQRENELRNRLLGIIGHDIRSPLAGLLGLVDLHDSHDVSPEEFNSWIEKLKPELHFTKDSLDRLVYWAKSKIDSNPPEPTAFSLGEMEQKLAEYFRNVVGDRNVNLQFNWDQNQQLLADSDAIFITFTNLLHNSLKVSPDQSTITVESVVENGRVNITIADEGPGMEEGLLSKIFQAPLAKEGAISKNEGMGLGLFLCREFIEMNQGTISVSNRLGGGAQFSITLASA